MRDVSAMKNDTNSIVRVNIHLDVVSLPTSDIFFITHNKLCKLCYVVSAVEFLVKQHSTVYVIYRVFQKV